MTIQKKHVRTNSINIDIEDLFHDQDPLEVIESINMLRCKYLTPATAKLVFNVSPYGYDGAIDLTLEQYRWETDEEVAHRVEVDRKKEEEKEKKRLAKLEKARKALYQAEQDERDEYERLKKKFGE